VGDSTRLDVQQDPRCQKTIINAVPKLIVRHRLRNDMLIAHRFVRTLACDRQTAGQTDTGP